MYIYVIAAAVGVAVVAIHTSALRPAFTPNVRSLQFANAGFATMADLKRKLHILQHLSPAISEKQPRTQTKCGGLLMMTLFPIAVVIYSLVWFNNCKPRHSPATSPPPAEAASECM